MDSIWTAGDKTAVWLGIDGADYLGGSPGSLLYTGHQDGVKECLGIGYSRFKTARPHSLALRTVADT